MNLGSNWLFMFGRNVLESLRNEYLGFQFRKRTSRNTQKAAKIGVGVVCLTFCNVAGNGHRRPADLNVRPYVSCLGKFSVKW